MSAQNLKEWLIIKLGLCFYTTGKKQEKFTDLSLFFLLE